MRNLIIFSFAALCAAAQDSAALPSNLRAPADQKLVFQARGIGDQIYACEAADGKYAWALKGPRAQLFSNDGRVLGRHFAGPTWEGNDGSRVLGKPRASVASPSPDAVPWLLLLAARHEGSGSMDKVLSIQRLNTKGGKAPIDGCDSSHAGMETPVRYEADYYFYGQIK